jgi:hypothetical protein
MEVTQCSTKAGKVYESCKVVSNEAYKYFMKGKGVVLMSVPDYLKLKEKADKYNKEA